MAYTLESTNTRLTGNIKTVFDGSNIYFESINSTSRLNQSTYKKVKFNTDNSYLVNLRNFIYKGNFVTDMYEVKKDLTDILSSNLSEQYSQLYKWGCYSTTSDSLNMNFRFFAPIMFKFKNENGSKILKNKPTHFVIYRVVKDHSNIYDVIKNGEMIKIFDLKKLDDNIFSRLEDCNINVQFKNEITISGFDYKSGNYINKKEWGFSDLTLNETTITEFENWITNSFSRNNSLYTNIQNIEFLFDDEYDGFCNYVGFYINGIEKGIDQIQEYSKDEVIRLFKESDSITSKYNDQTPTTYLKNIDNSLCLIKGKESSKYLDINVRLNPRVNEMIQLKLNGVVIYTLQLRKELIGNSVSDTVYNIVNEINNNYNGLGVSISSKRLKENKFRLMTNGLTYGDEITFFSTTKFISTDKPLYTIDVNKNSFVGYEVTDIVSTKYVPFESANKIKVGDIIANITKITKYDNHYIYSTDVVWEESTTTQYIEHINDEKQKIIIGELYDHVKLDTLNNRTNYNDILDFDIDLYVSYLINKVNSIGFKGSIESYYDKTFDQITSEEKTKYKNILLDSIKSFYNSTYAHKKYLIDDIDTNSGESTNVDNEYDRLKERSNDTIVKINKLYQFINKWSLENASDSYNNDYRLSIGLPFRQDNFSSTQLNENRDITEHTLSWFIIGEGRPPYLDINDNTINKVLSYSNESVDIQKLKNEQQNWFDHYLTYKTETQTKYSYSKLYKTFGQSGVTTIFKGVKYKLLDDTLDDYKFAIILKSNSDNSDIDLTTEFVRNDTFKTLTVVLHFYVPDPILTSLEEELTYYLDRSVLYFSKEIYSSKESNYSFGKDAISLNIFDDQFDKQINTLEITKNWYRKLSDGNYWFWVGRGGGQKFSSDFKTIFEVGKDYKVEYKDVNDINSPYYGCEITFKDIKFVDTNNFCCGDIIIKGNFNRDVDNVEDFDISDNLVYEIYEISVKNLIENPNTSPFFYKKDNRLLVAKLVASELAVFEKVITSNTNNERYKNITLSVFKDYITKVKTVTVNDDVTPYMTVVEPNYFSIGVSLSTDKNSTSKSITNLEKRYFYDMFRIGGNYHPSIIKLQNIDTNYLGERIYPMLESKFNDYRKLITNNYSNIWLQETLVKEFEKGIITTRDNIVFELFIGNTNDNTTFKKFDFYWNPMEIRNFSSITFNSYKTLTFETTIVDNTIDVVVLMKNKLKMWLYNSKESIQQTITNDTFYNACAVFLETFFKSYYIDNVIDNDGNEYDTYLSVDNKIIIKNVIPNNTFLTVTFKK